MSLMRRWPWVVIAIRSTSFSRAEFNNLVGGFAKSEDGVAGKTIIDQVTLSFFEVGAVLFHLFAFRQFQLIKVSRHPAVGNMDQQKFRTSQPGKRLDVPENGVVSSAVFKWNENVLIHVKNDERRMSDDEGTRAQLKMLQRMT